MSKSINQNPHHFGVYISSWDSAMAKGCLAWLRILSSCCSKRKLQAMLDDDQEDIVNHSTASSLELDAAEVETEAELTVPRKG